MSSWQERPCVCGSHYIQNKKYWLCPECVFKKNHSGKSRAEVYKERSKKKTTKNSGERLLFLEIWRERPHYCNKCGTYLGNTPKVHYFSHIKSKGAHPELRLDKNNIEILCLKCHQEYEFK